MFILNSCLELRYLRHYSDYLRAEWSRALIQVGVRDNFLLPNSRPATGPIQPPIQWVQCFIPENIAQMLRMSVDVQTALSPHMPFLRGAGHCFTCFNFCQVCFTDVKLDFFLFIVKHNVLSVDTIVLI